MEAQVAFHVSDSAVTSPGWKFEGPPGYNFEDAFVARPVIGSAIGIEGGGTATLGGYVELRAKQHATGQEKVMTLAISCHHSYSSMSGINLSVRFLSSFS